MASDFVGYSVVVTLQPTPQAPDAKIHGVVEDVRDQNLHLKDVTLLWSGQRLPVYTIRSFLIADLEISSVRPEALNDAELKTPTAAAYTVHPGPPTQALPTAATHALPPRPPPSQVSQPFVDPAILSYAKSRDVPKDLPNAVHLTPQPPVVSPVMIANGAVPSPLNNRQGQSSVSSVATAVLSKPTQLIQATEKVSTVTRDRKLSSATATLTEPFDALALDGDAIIGGQNGTKKSRRGRNGNIPSHKTPAMAEVSNATAASQPIKKGNVKGKGWRQTPLVEEVGPKRKQRNRARNALVDDANGWATEDATDIQDMGDFDFEANLGKFDKRQVFDDIRRDDNTADDERLVSFNRLAKPGTNGGRNLHFTENVLEPQLQEKWQSEAGETEEELREDHYSSGRGSRRAGSRRPLQSRKGSAFPALSAGLRTESPRPLTRIGTASPMNGSISGIRASFRMADNNKPCHCVSPLQMLEIEQLCVTELGLTEDMLTENAGRSVAEAVLKKEPPCKCVLFLVGNHKSGARAVAAARHLRNRRLRVTVCILGGEREEMLVEALRKQLSIYKKGGGYHDRWDEFQTKMAAGPQPGAMPGLIVDALFGVHVTFDELRTDDQATAFTMIRWANRSAATIVSVDVPSGLSATTGAVTEVDGQALMVNGKHIISLAAPKHGLLSAMAELGVEGWQVSVADIGISSAAWQKHGSRRRHGIEFGSEWVVPLKFVSRVSDS